MKAPLQLLTFSGTRNQDASFNGPSSPAAEGFLRDYLQDKSRWVSNIGVLLRCNTTLEERKTHLHL